MPSTGRRWIVLAVLGAGLAALALASGDGDERPRPPNIVVITTDDQALDSFRREVMPASFRMLVDEGTIPEDFIVTTPLCCPSRASLLTGQYGHNNGVLANHYSLLREKGSTLPAWLDRAGYRTVHVGKYLNNYENAVADPAEPAPGWDEWQTVLSASYYDYDLYVNGRARHFGHAPRDYLTRVLARRARRRIEAAAGAGEPLYLQLDLFAPHSDNAAAGGPCAGTAVPDPRDAGLFDDEPLPRAEAFNEAEAADKPSFLRGLPRLGGAEIAEVERRYRCTLASLRSVDRAVASVTGALERSGELERTLVVLMSDNGLLRGQHRIGSGKHVPYEEALAVPIAIRLGESLRGDRAPPARLRGPAANIDLAPTFLELAGAEPCAEGGCRVMDGRSLLPALRGERKLDPSRALVVELDESGSALDADGPCRYRGLRTPDHLYVEHLLAQDTRSGRCRPLRERELYDLRHDRAQLENLLPARAGSPAADVAETLAGRLERLAACAGIEGRDPRPPPPGGYCE